MRIAAILLIHDQPSIAERLISVLLAGGIDVVVHVDRNGGRGLVERLQNFCRDRRIAFAKSVSGQWGTFSLVRGTLNALETIRELGWRPDYVALLSGADFPIRSGESLRAFLGAHSCLDFIESTPVAQRWVRDGLQQERFDYFFFLNWRRRRRLFNLAYNFQRRAALFVGSRKPPAGVAPHLGSQWWTLRWSTCTAILDLVRTRPELVRFFRWTWIPDESFFQTLVRMVRDDSDVADSNLTYFEFDEAGRPLVLYDDHVQHLAEQPFFFGRKVSPRAERLREAMAARWLGPAEGAELPALRRPTSTFATFSRLDRHGHHGAPRAGFVYFRNLGALDWNVRRYVALLAPPSRQADAVAALVNEQTPVRLCGRLFGMGSPEFHPELAEVVRHLAAMPALRRVDPIGYWAEVLALAGEQPIGLVLSRAEAPALWEAIVADSNAIKIAFRPHPRDVWRCARAAVPEHAIRDEEQDYLDRLVHLSRDHEAARHGRGVVHVLECYHWRLAPDGAAVSRLVADLGGARMDPAALERRLVCEDDGPGMTDGD